MTVLLSSDQQMNFCMHFYTKASPFCLKCGLISVDEAIAVKHPRYDYQADISPREIWAQMAKNTLSFSSSSSSIRNESYRAIRKELISLIKRINNKLYYFSSTFFLSICYMDVIGDSIKQENGDYYLIAITCLCLASKYNEKDPLSPKLETLCALMSEVTKYRHVYSIEDIKRCEVFSLKALNYRLDYVTLYDYVVFFYIHGIMLRNQLGTMPYESIKKYLENVYVYSRDVIDKVLEENSVLFKYNWIDLSISAIRYGVTMAFGSRYGDLSSGVDSIFSQCYCYSTKYQYKAIQKVLKSAIESLMSNTKDKENISKQLPTQSQPQPQQAQQSVIELHNSTVIKMKTIVNQHKKQLSINNPNLSSWISSANVSKRNKKSTLPLSQLSEQVKSSHQDIIDKTKRLFGRPLLYNHKIQEIPRTIIINNNININIQRQISNLQLKTKKSNKKGGESNEEASYKQRIEDKNYCSARTANKTIDLY